MLCTSSLNYLMHLRKAMEHFRSNVCLSFQSSIPFPILIRVPQNCIFESFDRQCWWKWQCVTHKWHADAVKSSIHICRMHLMNSMTHPRSNGGLSIRYIIPYVVLAVYQTIAFYVHFEGHVLVENSK